MTGELADRVPESRPRAKGAQAPVGKIVYGDPDRRRSLPSRVIGRAKLVWIFRTPVFCDFIKSSDCAVTVFMTSRGKRVVGKFFARSDLGVNRLAAERKSYELFADREWRMPVLGWRSQGFLVPRLSDEDRLDVASERMTEDERLKVAVWALDVLLEIYVSGHFHGDFQPHNAWLINGRPVATDFESLTPRTQGIPFLQSGDITGVDPAADARPIYSAFGAHDKWSYHHVLGVSLEQATEALRAQLSERPSTDEVAQEKLAALEGGIA